MAVAIDARAPVRWLDRASGWRRAHAKQLRKFGLVLAILTFGGGLYWSANGLIGSGLKFRLLPCLVLVGVLQPLGLVINAASFRVMAKMADVDIGWGSALRTTIYARAANFLPIPGGFVTRVSALRLSGATVRDASVLTILTTGIWGGLAFGFAGVWLAGSQPLVGCVFGAIFLCGFAVCAVGFRHVGVRPSLVGGAVLVRIAGLTLESFGMMAGFMAIGSTASFSQSASLVVSTFVGTALAIFPGGLGIREGTAALLAPLAGLDPASGFLAASLLRGLALFVLTLAAGLAYLTTKGSES